MYNFNRLIEILFDEEDGEKAVAFVFLTFWNRMLPLALVISCVWYGLYLLSVAGPLSIKVVCLWSLLALAYPNRYE